MQPLSRTQEEIANAWEGLEKQWQQTSAIWFDANRFWFEHTYWQSYEPEVRNAMLEIEKLGDILSQAYRSFP